MDLADSSFCSQHPSVHSSHHSASSWAAIIQNYSEATGNLNDGVHTSAPDDIDTEEVVSKLDSLRVEIIGPHESVNNIGIKTSRIKAGASSNGSASCSAPPVSNEQEPYSTPASSLPQELQLQRPFHKWMKTIQRRATQRPKTFSTNHALHWQRDSSASESSNAAWTRPLHRKSSSGSSFAFVSAVRSASASFASVSVVTRPRRQGLRSQRLSSTECSSRASMLGPRVSEDSCILDSPSLADVAAIDRALRRRQVLEELISTEEAYIGDVRFLMNVYVTILASLPSEHMGLRSSINRNLTEIIELHEEILGEMHRIVPHSEYTQIDVNPPPQAWLSASRGYNHGHRCGTSLSAVPEGNLHVTWLENVPGMLTEPQVAAEVSKVFAKKINRFFIYEEYGTAYEIMIKDMSTAQQIMPEWETYQKGIEALASTIGSAKVHEDGPRKCLTTSDLLVKPIQRICKYPLLFSELLKHTPVADCPNSHMEVDSVLTRLREATAEINRASDDVGMKMTLEKTWLLQDRLVFPDRKLDAFSKKQIRSFGHVRLCGVLHVCWQTSDGVDGQYMICLLYRDILCLASAGRIEPVYTILACINIHDASIEEADNGRGLQCHTAPFSWKLVFVCDHQMHEVIMTACTPKEEKEWRSKLSRSIRDPVELRDPNMFSSLFLNVKSMGSVFGKPGTVARHMSMHRATTVGPKSPLCQVVLKNTSVVRDAPNNTSAALSINRSQSLLTTATRIPVLAPARSERARLEALLSDVWSREVLPFPGMTARSRSDNIVKSSASSVMRKLSVASIASSFSKRPGSLNRRSGSSEHATISETCQRRDSGIDVSKSGDTDAEVEHKRRAKRQRTGCIMTEGKTNVASDLDPADMAEMVHRRTPEVNGNGTAEPFAGRKYGRGLHAPNGCTSAKKLAHSSPFRLNGGRLSKSPPERVVKKLRGRRFNICKNENATGIRRLFLTRKNG